MVHLRWAGMGKGQSTPLFIVIFPSVQDGAETEWHKLISPVAVIPLAFL